MLRDSGWRAGDPIVYREVLRGRVWTARPVTVLEDTPEAVALYLAHGTRWQCFTSLVPGAAALQCKAGRVQWELGEMEWKFGGTVIVSQPGDAHATHIMWNLAHEFIGWYVNLQEPLRRTRMGFDFLDQELDIVVKPNWDWQWKDEAHLAEAEAWGVFTPAQCAAIRAEAQRVIAKIEARAAPFDGRWLDWQAPADWAVPSLPAGWEVVP